MKKATHNFLLAAGIISLGFACTKRDDVPKKEVIINQGNLTSCPAGADCRYLFSDNADITLPQRSQKAGAFRLFWSETQTSVVNTAIYIKAPMGVNSFSMGREDVLSGRIALSRSCPACSMVPVKPVDGYANGVNLTPDRPGDQTRWLIEARIIVEAQVEPFTKDTINVKQIFYPNFVYN